MIDVRLFERKWRSLPDAQRTPQQVAGVAAVACGATHSIMEQCNFACTSCYLTELANATEPLPFPQIQAQLRELRRHLGEGGKAQITSGEVTLLSVPELGRIVAFARQIGLDPMVMTNGERWLESPEQLEALVEDYGLDKVSIHIDTTQRGRRGLVSGSSERDLHTLRDRFAGLVRDVRRKTGRALHAAQTVTVTESNLDGVPDVTRWALDNAEAFRLVSFMPVASVGRTEDRRSSAITLERVWELVCVGAGKNLNRHAMHFGHTECNITVPVVVLRCGTERHLVEVVRAEKAWDLSVFSWVLRNLHPVLELGDGLAINALRVARGVLTRPRKASELMAYALYRLWGERRGIARLARELVRFRPPRVHPILLVVHQFMNPAELDTPLGRERLDACVFKLPVNGRMVSMCEMNGTGLRRELNQIQLKKGDRYLFTFYVKRYLSPFFRRSSESFIPAAFGVRVHRLGERTLMILEPFRLIAFLLCALLLGALATHAQEEGFPVLATLELGEAPHQISFDATGRTAYVAAAGSDWVAVVDVESRQMTKKLAVANTPLGVIPGPSGELLATRFRADGIVRLRERDGASLAELTTGGAPSLFAPLPGGRWMVSVEKANRLWILDANKAELTRSYETGGRPFPPAATSDGRLAFVPDYDDGTVSVIDLWNERLHGHTRVGVKPSGGAVLYGDIDYVVALRGENRLAFINTATFRVVDSLSEGIGDGPFSVVVTPNGRLAFINNTASHDVSVLDVASRRVITKIPVGEIPIAMAVHPSGETLWVASEGSHTVSIVGIDEDWLADVSKPTATSVTEVAVMGMIHGRHRVSQTWGLTEVRETIERFQPDIICAEIPPNRWERVKSDYAVRGAIEDSRFRRFPEYTDVILPLTRTMDFELVPCAAWTREMSDLREKRSHQFKTDAQFAEANREYEAGQAEILARRPSWERMEDPRFIHSDAFDALLKEELVGYDEALNDWYGPGGWSTINEGHMRHINDTIDAHPGKRILVTFGAGHKYWFLERLRERDDVRLVDLEPYLPESNMDIDNETTDVCERCRSEVFGLHQFFEDWFTGKNTRSDQTFERFLGVLTDDFEIVSPEGKTSSREEIAEAVIVAHSRFADQGFRIWIENFSARPSSDDSWVVTYEEWQQQDGAKRGRASTAVFRRDPSTVNGVRWQHVHETWLPEP